MGFFGRISEEICSRIREGASGGILGGIFGKYLKYLKVKSLKGILKSLKEFSKESLNLAEKFPRDIFREVPAGFFEQILEKF